MKWNPHETQLVVVSADAYDFIREGMLALERAEPALRGRPFFPDLLARPANATAVELWHRPELRGLLHALRLHGYMATHPATRQFEFANAHFAEALMGDYMNVRKFIEAAISAFYEAFVFVSIARTGITCEFIPSTGRSKSPDILLPKMRMLVECKDIQGRALSAWTIPNLGRRIRERHEEATLQFDRYDSSNTFARMVFVDLPDDNAPLGRVLKSKQILDLYAQILDAGESPSFDRERASTLIMTSSSVYHLVERPLGGPRPMVVPRPLTFPSDSMVALFLDALFQGEGHPPWAYWQPAITAQLQFEYHLPSDYKKAKSTGQMVAYLSENY
jgi:hypothetical protein